MNKKGFTLVEIIAVIVILAVLAAAATIGVISTLNKQRQKLAYTAEQNVHDASISYYSKNATYLKTCTDSSGANIVISQKNVEEANNYLREKFKDFSGESLYQLYKNYSINGNDDPANKYELDPYIKVSNRSCYKLITVGELIEQGLISDSDGMCNKSSMIVVYRKADAKNTAGITESVQEAGICKSDRKSDIGPVVTITPPSDLSLSNSKKIKVMVTTESTKLKTSFTMQYGWSKTKTSKPSSYTNLSFSGNTEKSGSAEISIGTLDETRYLWIKAGTELDNRNNKTSEMIAGPYAFLPTVFVTYDVNTGDTSSCPAKKTVVFSKTYGKNINDVEEELCEPTKIGYDFKGWYKDDVVKIENGTKVTQKTDHTLVAKWEPHIYTITLDKNLATNNPTSSIKVTYDTNKLAPTTITVPVRTYTVKGFGLDAERKSNGASVSSTASLISNYVFNGWTTTKNGSNILLNNEATPVLTRDLANYTENGVWRKSTDTTVYAKWTSAAVTLPTIIKTGFDCGWTTSETGTSITNASGSSYTPTANTEMYGVCSACKYKIIFNKNNASATGTTADKECTYDSSCKLTKNGYTLSGHTFNGWNTKRDKTGTNYADEATIKNLTDTCNGTVNMYANWCQNCVDPVSHGSCSLIVNVAGTCTYTTSCDAGYKLTSGASTRNPTCTSIQFNIAYDANGGSGAPASHSCTYDDTCNLSNTKPTIENGTFNKWNSKSSCNGTNYDSGASVKNASKTDGATVTYYACYKCNDGYEMVNGSCKLKTYLVKYSATGASNVPGDQTKYHGVDLTLDSKVPTMNKKTFNGWEDTFSVIHKAGGKYTKNKNTTMTAKWCDNCNLATNSHATCNLDATTPGTCTYITACDTDYVYDSGANTKSPKCKCSDKKPPTVSNVVVTLKSANSVTVTFNASDTGCSGLNKYNVSIAGKSVVISDVSKKTVDITGITQMGNKSATVTAYDKAGNHGSNTSSPICIPVSYKLSSKTYKEGDTVNYICTDWVVIKDNGKSTVLVRKKGLNKQEIMAAGIPIDKRFVDMADCNNSYCQISHCAWSDTNPNTSRCWVKGDRDTTTYLPNSINAESIDYDWGISYVRDAIVYYFHHSLLPNAYNDNALKLFTIKEGRNSATATVVKNYIRIPSLEEAKGEWPKALANNGVASWTYTFGNVAWENRFSPINRYGNTALKVNPVIEVSEQ